MSQSLHPYMQKKKNHYKEHIDQSIYTFKFIKLL